MSRLLALLLTIVVASLVTTSPARAQDVEDLVGVAGNRYESPTWGYALAWDDDDWSPVLATSDGGVDLLYLRSRRSGLVLQGGPFRGSAEECLADAVAALSSEPGVDDWEALEDEDGEPIAGTAPGRAWAAFALTFTNAAGEVFEDVDYVECRILVADEAALLVFHNTRAKDHSDEVAEVAEVLATLTQAANTGKHGQVVGAEAGPPSAAPASADAAEGTSRSGERPENCDAIAPWFAEVRPIVVRADDLLRAGDTDPAAYASLAEDLSDIAPAPGTAEFQGALVAVLEELAAGYEFLSELIASMAARTATEEPVTGWSLDFDEVNAFLDERIARFYALVEFGDDYAAACGFADGWLAMGEEPDRRG